MEKWQKHNKNHIQESQEASPFPAGDYKATMHCKKTWQTQNINNKNNP